jgi:hypothetical protein
MPLGLDVEVPTAYGWVTVAAIKPGMELLDEAGYPVRVVLASPAYEEQGYRLRLGYGKVKSPEPDGDLVVGAGQRLLAARHQRLERWHNVGLLGAEVPSNWPDWVPGAHRGSGTPAPFAEEVLVEDIEPWVEVKHGGDDVRRYLNYAIPTTASLQLQGGRADLDPWVAGVCINYWDSSSEVLKLRVKELEFYQKRFAAAGYSLIIPDHDEKSRYKHLKVGVDERLSRQLSKYLSRGGLPGWIFRAPERDRMEFLAGLMDRWDFPDFKDDTRAGAWFYTTDGVLARGVCELVRTLGYPATLRANKQVRKDRGGDTIWSGFYVLWSPLWLPFTRPELQLRYSHMTYRAGMSVQRFLWKIYEAEKIERILVRDIVVEGRMFAAGRLLVPVRSDDGYEAG